MKRIENILRGEGDIIEATDIQIHPSSGAVYMAEEEVQLTKKNTRFYCTWQNDVEKLSIAII